MLVAQSKLPVDYVNPFIGTGAVDSSSLSGSNFPGATLPFAFVQLSPDTQDSPLDPSSGYNYNDKTIFGFSHTHLSGTGVADLFDVLLIPTTVPCG
jgi:putative alpha-1,2-mannosidase